MQERAQKLGLVYIHHTLSNEKVTLESQE